MGFVLNVLGDAEAKESVRKGSSRGMIQGIMKTERKALAPEIQVSKKICRRNK
jgi:hypothetical protein